MLLVSKWLRGGRVQRIDFLNQILEGFGVNAKNDFSPLLYKFNLMFTSCVCVCSVVSDSL